MFNILMSKKSMMVLPVAAALMLTGCEEEEIANSPEPAPVDLTQTEDLFSAPVKPNPLTTDPAAVVVRVNGEDITLGEINEMMAEITVLKGSVMAQVVELSDHMSAAAGKGSDGTLEANERSNAMEQSLATLDQELTQVSASSDR